MINLFSPLRTVMIFIIFGIIWLLATESLLRFLAEHIPALFWHGHFLKGLVFISINAVLLYWLLNKYLTSLHHSENAYIRIFKESPHAMWIYDRNDLRFLKVNDAALSIYGYSMEEFMRMTILDIRPEEDVMKILNNQSSYTEGFQAGGTWRHKKKDGTLMYIQIQSFGTSYKGKEAEVVSIWDVTDKYLADEALMQQEKLLNTIINSTEDLIWAVSADKHFIAFNNAFQHTIQNFVGVHLQVGDSITKAETESDHLRWRNFYDKVLRGEKLVIEEAQELEGFGMAYAEITFNPIVVEGKITGVACFTRDITERKQHEIQLKKALERYEIVSLATNDVVWDWDLATNKVIWNANIKELFGYEEVDEDVSWWKSLVHPDDYTKAVFTLEEVIRTRLKQWEVEYRFKNADGAYRYVNDRGYVLYNEDGQPARVIGAMQDIEDKKNYIEELQHVAHMSSHGMRRPVASMLGVVSLLNKENLADPENGVLLEYIEKISKEMDDILHVVAEKCNAIFMDVEKE